MTKSIEDIFSLAGWKPLRNITSVTKIEELEKRISHKLPLMFRDFLSCSNAQSFLEKYSNCDRPIALCDIGKRDDNNRNDNPLDNNLLCFMHENQFVWTWAVALNEGEDPPVFIRLNEQNTVSWRLAAKHFSLWLNCQVADRQLIQRTSLTAQSTALDKASLAQLQERFDEGPQTSGPADINYRFSNANSRLLLWNIEYTSCDWWVEIQPGATLEPVMNELDLIENLSGNIYACNDKYSRELELWRKGQANE